MTFVKQKTVVAMKVQTKVQDFYKYPKFLQDNNWVKTFLELIHVKISQLVASLSTNCQQVVLVLLAPTTCNNSPGIFSSTFLLPVYGSKYSIFNLILKLNLPPQ